MKRVLVLISAAWLLLAGVAAAQTTTASGTVGDRPATTTILGDTGFWFVPSADVLRPGRGSVSFARLEADFEQGFTDVSQWPLTGALGFGRGEVFGAWNVITRIDRDTDPLFSNQPVGSPSTPSGLLTDFPSARESWSGTKLGDLYLGGKAGLQQYRNWISATARGIVKVPTADEEEGVGTGKMDWILDGVASRLMGGFEATGYAGYIWRGDPDGINLADGFRWGAGARYPSGARLRGTFEVFGEQRGNTTAVPGLIVAEDGTLNPFLSREKDPTNISGSVTFQTRGLFFDAGIIYGWGIDKRSDFGQADKSRDALGYMFRVGWHPGVGSYMPPPPAVAAIPVPPAPVPAPEPTPIPNRNPTLDASCTPCVVEQGETLTLEAIGQDPDGDPLTFRWSTPAGTVTDPAALLTTLMAPNVPGTVLVTVIADDGRGGLARDTITIEVRARPVGTVGVQNFNHILFDFDQATLRPDAVATLNGVVTAMRSNPGMRLEIEGHADDRGSAEYNFLLGQRRANIVRDYLVSQGVSADRITTVSYGETRPASTDRTEAGRALNRRAVVLNTVVQ